MSDLISVIVPVYNVEKYIEECLESLIKQTYQNLEIILIDDGSTDASGGLCDKYAALDSRIKVIHQKNGGAANAKNNGLKIATGDYLAFADSDDYVERDAYEHMLKLLKNEKADVVQCCYRDLFTDKSVDHIIDGKQSFTTEEYLGRYTVDWTCGLLWDKLYKRELFNNIFFEEGHIIDDEYFTYQGVMNAKKIIHDSKIVYNYRQRKSSVTGLQKNKNRMVFDKLDYLVKRRNKIASRFPNLTRTFDNHLFSMLIWLTDGEYVSIEIMEAIKTVLCKQWKNVFFCGLSFRQMMRLFKIRYGRNDCDELNDTASNEAILNSYFD